MKILHRDLTEAQMRKFLGETLSEIHTNKYESLKNLKRLAIPSGVAFSIRRLSASALIR